MKDYIHSYDYLDTTQKSNQFQDLKDDNKYFSEHFKRLNAYKKEHFTKTKLKIKPERFLKDSKLNKGQINDYSLYSKTSGLFNMEPILEKKERSLITSIQLYPEKAAKNMLYIQNLRGYVKSKKRIHLKSFDSFDNTVKNFVSNITNNTSFNKKTLTTKNKTKINKKGKAKGETTKELKRSVISLKKLITKVNNETYNSESNIHNETPLNINKFKQIYRSHLNTPQSKNNKTLITVKSTVRRRQTRNPTSYFDSKNIKSKDDFIEYITKNVNYNNIHQPLNHYLRFYKGKSEDEIKEYFNHQKIEFKDIINDFVNLKNIIKEGDLPTKMVKLRQISLDHKIDHKLHRKLCLSDESIKTADKLYIKTLSTLKS